VTYKFYQDVEDLFWERALPIAQAAREQGNGACWLWSGTKNAAGYGLLWVPDEFGGYYESVHRLSYEIFWLWQQPLRDRMALHHCDTPACFNPLHLYPGTAADNALDRRLTHLTPMERFAAVLKRRLAQWRQQECQEYELTAHDLMRMLAARFRRGAAEQQEEVRNVELTERTR
jgi:hypothetical protein